MIVVNKSVLTTHILARYIHIRISLHGVFDEVMMSMFVQPLSPQMLHTRTHTPTDTLTHGYMH